MNKKPSLGPKLPSPPPGFNTPLKPGDEAAFRSWKAKAAPADSGVDYDWRGAYKAGLKPDKSGHWPDTFKKPNHPTFSNESRYAPYGNPGRWVNGRFVPPRPKGAR